MYGLTPYPITPIGCFIGVILALLPLISQIRKFSLGVWGFALWVAIANFILFVNTIIWHNSVENVAPVWCDITTKLNSGAELGRTASSLAVSLHLYKITHHRASLSIRMQSQFQRRKTVVCELLLVVGIPVLFMGLVVTIQPMRFSIIEEEGCQQTIYSYLGYILVYLPSFVLSLVCLILAPLTLRTFIRHRKEMNEYLSSGQGITRSKYNRLMAMACMDTLFNLPTTIGVVVKNVLMGKQSGLNYPYISWKNVHEGEGGNLPGGSLSSILQTPASEWGVDRDFLITVKWNEWFSVVSAVVFFAIFGTTPEMRRYYRSALWWLPERLGFNRGRTSEQETISDVAFSSNPNGQQVVRPRNSTRRLGSLSPLETTINTNEDRTIVTSRNVLEEGGDQVEV